MYVRGYARYMSSIAVASASDKNGSHQCFFSADVTAVSFSFRFSLWTVTLGRTGNANVRRLTSSVIGVESPSFTEYGRSFAMKHCPNCFSEYEDSAIECSDCRVELTEGEPTDDQRSFAGIHRNPSGFLIGTRIILAVSLFCTLIILGAISTWLMEPIYNRFIPGGLSFVLAWYSFKWYKKRRAAYKTYQAMRANGYGKPLMDEAPHE